MEFEGTAENIQIDYTTGDTLATFRTHRKPAEVAEMFRAVNTKLLTIKAEIKRNKRTLDANSYFHVLVSKISEAMTPPESKTKTKNILICRYGQPLFIDESPAVIKTQIPPEIMEQQETLHAQPCGCKEENGLTVFYYHVFRGSHTYDTKEMAVLIDGTVQEAKALGVETLTPDELERLRGYEKQNTRA